MDTPLSTPCNIQICEVTCDSFRIMWDMTPEDTARATHFFIDLSRKESRDPNRFKHRVWQRSTTSPTSLPSFPFMHRSIPSMCLLLRCLCSHYRFTPFLFFSSLTGGYWWVDSQNKTVKDAFYWGLVGLTCGFSSPMIFCIRLNAGNSGCALSVTFNTSEKGKRVQSTASGQWLTCTVSS